MGSRVEGGNPPRHNHSHDRDETVAWGGAAAAIEERLQPKPIGTRKLVTTYPDGSTVTTVVEVDRTGQQTFKSATIRKKDGTVIKYKANPNWEKGSNKPKYFSSHSEVGNGRWYAANTWQTQHLDKKIDPVSGELQYDDPEGFDYARGITGSEAPPSRDDTSVRNVWRYNRVDKKGYKTFNVVLADGTKFTVKVKMSDVPKGMNASEVARTVGRQISKLPPDIRKAVATNEINFMELGSVGSSPRAATIGGGSLNIDPIQLTRSDTDFHDVMIHEVAHMYQPKTKKEYEDYLEAVNADGNAPSEYAQTNLGEDFAESFTLWQAVRSGRIKGPKARRIERAYANRFAYFDEMQRQGRAA